MTMRGVMLEMVTLVLALLAEGGVADSGAVTCRSAVKLESESTRARLHSHGVAYGSGSGQQSVTGQPAVADANSYWLILGRATRSSPGTGPAGGEESCSQGTPIRNGDSVRLMHPSTSKFLHSHHHRSPLGGGQEVSAFGSTGSSDTGDNWVVELDSASVWHANARVRLRHADTGQYLSCHDRKYGRPINGQLEVFASSRKSGRDSSWSVAEAVIFPPGEGNEEHGEKEQEEDSSSASTSHNASEL
jgi:dolichyl-phosphate-mannose--protein O-mannosyl transferase